MEVTSRSFLEGHVLRKAMLIFEDALGPWVKEQVEAHSLAKHGTGQTRDHWRNAAAHAELVEARRAERTRLMALRHKLDERFKACDKQHTPAVRQEQREVTLRLRTLDPDKDPPSPVPRWASECPVGSTTANFLRHDTRWDVHTIVSVMQGLMKDVFARHLPDHFHAKHLLSGIVKVLTLRADRAHGAALAEPDVLEALQRMREVVRLCGRDAKHVTALGALLNETQALVGRARGVSGNDGNGGAACQGPTLTADEANAQRLFEALSSWALHVEVTMGLVVAKDDGTPFERVDGRGQLEFSNRTVGFGRDFDASNKKWSATVKRLGAHFKLIAPARHWYFHHLVEEQCDIAGAFAAMQAVADALEQVERSPTPWQSPPVADGETPTKLILIAPSVRMRPPMGRAKVVVGRGKTVGDVTAALVPPGARVLIHGLPGVGKDTVMAEVANRDEVRSMGGLQAWVQASSDAVLRQQMIDLFKTHQPRVVMGLDGDADASILAIKRWLAAHVDWFLFVEDASLASATLWEMLPDNSNGRVLVTSQADLSKQHGLFSKSRFELAPITTNDSVELLRLKNALRGKAPPLEPSPPSAGGDIDEEAALRDQCAAAGAIDVYRAPVDGNGESKRDKRERHSDIQANLAEFELRRCCVDDAAWCYITPPAEDEKSADRKRRHKAIEQRLFEHGELSRPELRDFLENTLGNLPLSVELFANVLRRDRDGSVLSLIKRFKRMGSELVAEADRGGREQEDRHFFGLTLSVRVCLNRLREASGVLEVDRSNAISLLSFLSLLHRSRTPLSLLTGHRVVSAADIPGYCYAPSCRAGAGDKGCLSASCTRQRRIARLLAVLGDAGALQRARSLCIEHGLLQEPAEGDEGIVGVMHQLVQQCLMRELAVLPSVGENLVDMVRVLLMRRFEFNSRTTPMSRWEELRRVAPCVEAWGKHVLGDVADGRHGQGNITCTAADHTLLTRLSELLLTANGDASTASRVLKSVLEHQKVELPPDDPDIARSMHNLAGAYNELGRHNDALTMLNEELAFRRRVLPSGHPDIAMTMGQIASTYRELGRHEDALKMNEETLAFMRRVLPADHPNIVAAMNNLAIANGVLSRHEDALKLFEEALAFQRRVLPADHPDLTSAMANLAITYGKLGRQEDALKMSEEVLTIQRRVLPADHPIIASSMGNLATTYMALGRHEDALKMNEEVLAIMRRVLPQDHPRIAQAMHNVATSHVFLRQYEDARKMHAETLAFQRRVLPPDHPEIVKSMSNLADTYVYLGRRKDALKLHDEVMAFRRRAVGHPGITELRVSSVHSLLAVLEHGGAWVSPTLMAGAAARAPRHTVDLGAIVQDCGEASDEDNDHSGGGSGGSGSGDDDSKSINSDNDDDDYDDDDDDDDDDDGKWGGIDEWGDIDDEDEDNSETGGPEDTSQSSSGQ